MTFQELSLNNDILKSIDELGFVEPTPIQQQSIPKLLEFNSDFVGLAQTGTGKTAAFGLPIIQNIDLKDSNVQAIILCPTRELCLQITKELLAYSKYVKGVNPVAVYGGANINEQIKQIKRGANIIVGTPGRTIDHINRKTLRLDRIKVAVLDEADEMLNMGFKEDIDEILQKTPNDKLTWLFSATMPREVERIAKTFMENPLKVVVGSQNSSAENIEHKYALAYARDHYYALKRFLDYYPKMFAMVFCRTKRETADIAEKLTLDGYNADALHGDLSQAQRDNVMRRFRTKSIQVLVCTDVAARGIDVDDVTHVFHMNLPEDIESYTHRSGRTARAGKSGMSIAIVSPRDTGKIKQIERQIGKQLTYMKIPSGDAICSNQLLYLIQQIHDVEINEKSIQPFMDAIAENLAEFDKDTLIKRFISVEFNRFLKSYENAKDLNLDPKRVKHSENTSKSSRRNDQNSNRLFINVGKKDGFTDPGKLINFICRNAGIDGKNIGRIDLFDQFSFFGIPAELGEKVINGLSGNELDGREIKVEFSKDKQRSKGRSGKSNRNYSRSRSY